jgi:hypothetical protein
MDLSGEDRRRYGEEALAYSVGAVSDVAKGQDEPS